MGYISQLLPLELVIFSGFTNLVVGIYIYLFSYKLSDKNYISAKYFAYVCFSVFSWTFWIVLNCIYIDFLQNKFFIYFFNIFTYISFLTIIQTFLFFAISFHNNLKINHRYNFLYYPYILVLILVIVPELGLFNLNSSKTTISYNPLIYYIVIAYIISYFTLYIKILINKYKTTNNRNIKMNTVIFLIFTTFPVVFGFITNILSPFVYQNTNLIYYGPVLTLFIIFGIIISILKYNLFYIKLPVTSLLLTLIITLILLITRFSIMENHMFAQLQTNILFILMFSCLYIFLTKEVYIGFKKQLVLDSKKKELEIALDSKNNFLKSSSHQFRTPLTVILGYLDMIVNKENNKYEFNKVTSEDLQKAYISAKNLNEIINDVLSANEINVGKFGVNIKDTINLKKLLQSIIYEKQELLSSKSTKVNFELKGKNENALIDVSKIKEAINNILDNAIFYGRGKIEIVLDTRKKFFEISIKDNGIGITATDEKKIWLKFERGKRSPKINPNGSGLGLYLAKQIVLKHGGDIVLHSDGLNKGSKFILKIPKNIMTLNSTESFNNIKSNI